MEAKCVRLPRKALRDTQLNCNWDIPKQRPEIPMEADRNALRCNGQCRRAQHRRRLLRAQKYLYVTPSGQEMEDSQRRNASNCAIRENLYPDTLSSFAPPAASVSESTCLEEFPC